MREIYQSHNVSSHLAGRGQQSLFHLSDINIDFKGISALKSVTMSVNTGEILFITGKSGAGKTTLLNLLAGDIEPGSGRIIRPSNEFFVAQVFQDLKLLENYTCAENLWYAYDSTIYKNKAEFEQDMMELVNILGISEHLKMPLNQVNGGMKQKIALVRALLSRPNILLADEPTCSLDKESSIKLFELLNFYNLKRKLTVIWASHNRELVKQFPGKIVHLEAGKLIYSGHACFI